jgi:hypothetical protein
MQYMGGKSRIARHIAAIINDSRGANIEIPRWQEPYSDTSGTNNQCSTGGGRALLAFSVAAVPWRVK